MLIDEFLVVGNQSLGNGLSHSAGKSMLASLCEIITRFRSASHPFLPQKLDETPGMLRRPSNGNVLDLRSVTTTGDADADVQLGELVEADDQEGLVDLLCGNKNRQHDSPTCMQAHSHPRLHISLLQLKWPQKKPKSSSHFPSRWGLF